MSENYARSILRLIAITTMMVGLSLTAHRYIIQMGVGKTVAGFLSDTVAPIGNYYLFANLAIVALGLALFAFSSKLAHLVVE